MTDLQQRKLYHQVEPQSLQASYNQFNQIDFLISCGANRSLVKNSVRILADVRILTDNAQTRATGGVLFNRNVGGHAFIDNITTSFAGGQGAGAAGGLIENLQNYPRWCAMGAVASLNEYDMLNGSNQCELRGVNDLVMAKYANGIAPTIATGTANIVDVDMSIKPECALNRMSGGDLPFNKTGIVTLNINLARDMDALFGGNQTAACNYELRNLRCTYQSVPDSKTPEPTSMNIEYNVKSNILSGTASLSANVPAICSGVSINFIQSGHSSVPVFDSYRLENPTQLNSVQYMVNDKTNSLTTYTLTDRTEILERFISSMQNTGRNQVSLDKYRSNSSFCCGLDFDGGIDLSQNRFTFQIVSGVSAAFPMNVFSYFHSTVTV